MRRVALLLLLAAPAAPQARIVVKAEDLPRVKKVEEIPEVTPFAFARVELDAHGRLYVNGSRATLHEVDAYVLRTTEERVVWRRRQGEEGMDKLPSGIEGSNVHVHVRAHRDAPWRHVQWILAVCGAQRAYKTEFLAVDGAGKEGVVRAWLPFDAAEEGGFEFPEGDADETERAPRERPNTLTLTILVEGTAPRTFAGKEVEGPASIEYAVGKRKTSSREKFEEWLAEELRASKETVAIRAHAKVPLGEVVAVVDAVRKRGHDRVDVYRAEVPSRAERALRDLPYPE